ncbi:DUF4369 domain-containing protein [Flammeovirga aprica]|uniref:DUF4369 domain-containing protein n=1 Tax=Flammeovirga aprica JL-4 TaxID=694437 RepID=A0A7X9NYX5_9BACT|nr:DUF4369 domain-containing protein [Flammeovirga aprica]NME66486.1 DUF4369 domain-containing protein [Flammeovirga aprica JL-4]
MMKTIIKLSILLFTLFATSCSNYPANVSISGTTQDITEGTKVTLTDYFGGQQVAETVVDANGFFDLQYAVPKIGIYSLTIGDSRPFDIVLEDKDLIVEGFGKDKDFQFLIVSGSEENELMNRSRIIFDLCNLKGTREKKALEGQEIKKVENENNLFVFALALPSLLEDMDGSYCTMWILDRAKANPEVFANTSQMLSEATEKVQDNFPDDSVVVEMSKDFIIEEL